MFVHFSSVKVCKEVLLFFSTTNPSLLEVFCPLPNYFLYSFSGNESSIHVSETRTKLVLSKKPNEGMVEGRVIYGQGDEIDASDSPLKSTFLSTVSSLTILVTFFHAILFDFLDEVSNNIYLSY